MGKGEVVVTRNIFVLHSGGTHDVNEWNSFIWNISTSRTIHLVQFGLRDPSCLDSCKVWYILDSVHIVATQILFGVVQNSLVHFVAHNTHCGISKYFTDLCNMVWFKVAWYILGTHNLYCEHPNTLQYLHFTVWYKIVWYILGAGAHIVGTRLPPLASGFPPPKDPLNPPDSRSLTACCRSWWGSS